MRAVKKLSLAEADILESASWYDDEEPGLGEDFIREIDDLISSLANDAFLYRIRFADVRCARPKRFWKHGVFYFAHNNEVIVFAVMHAARHPRRLRIRRKSIG